MCKDLYCICAFNYLGYEKGNNRKKLKLIKINKDKIKTNLIWQKKKLTMLWFHSSHTFDILFIFKIPKTVVIDLILHLKFFKQSSNLNLSGLKLLNQISSGQSWYSTYKIPYLIVRILPK